MTARSTKVQTFSWILRAIVAFIILTLGVLVFKSLKAQRPKSVSIELPKKYLKINVIPSQLKDQAIELNAFARVRSSSELSINSELNAKLNFVSPLLKVGEIIQKGELLFTLDPEEFKLTIASRLARIETSKSEITENITETAQQRKILLLKKQSAALAEREFLREQKLHQQKISPESQLIAAEKALIQAKETVLNTEKMILSLTNQVQIKKNRQTELKRDLALATLNLKRCKVYAPHTMRLTKKMIENGQFVTRGQLCLKLIDDSKLEIICSLNGPAALQRLSLKEGSFQSWGERFEKRPVTLRWTESPKVWKGQVQRIEEYNSLSRSLKVLIEAEQKATQYLMPGMFCEVTIPAQSLKNCLKVPYFSYKNGQLLIEKDGLLMFEPAQKLYDDGDYIYLRPLKKGDSWNVVSTQLNSPVQLTPVKIIENERE